MQSVYWKRLSHKSTNADLKCYLGRQLLRFWNRAYESLLKECNDEGMADRL